MEEQLRYAWTADVYSSLASDPKCYTPFGSYPSGYHGYTPGYYPYPWPLPSAYDSAYNSHYGAHYAYPLTSYAHPDFTSSVLNVTERHDVASPIPSCVERQDCHNAPLVTSHADDVPSHAVTSSVTPSVTCKIEKCPTDDRDSKPPYSYIALVAMAISNDPRQMATLREITDYIKNRFPYYRNKTTWQRSLRHCLTLNDCFVKKPRRTGDKGHPWAIDPDFKDMFDNGSLMRRRYRFKEGSANWHRSRARAARRSNAKMEKHLPAISSPECWLPQADEHRGALDVTLASDNSVLSGVDVTLSSENSVLSSASPLVLDCEQTQDFSWSCSAFGLGN